MKNTRKPQKQKLSRKRNTQNEDLPLIPKKVKLESSPQDSKTPLRTFQHQQQHRARDHARDESKE
jgi:hypothetical protein